MNRKLLRPTLSEVKEKMAKEAASKKKVPPPYETYAENYYYLKQMNKKTPMAIVLIDGEVVQGYIEWYDRYCIKLNREDAPNLLIFKNNIKYLYKLNDKKKEASAQETRKK
ncbi:MAG: RNA chaperone Hfq [Candidatus Aminicenantes bacterium]|nr:RNA chaperone Hfq [Candidatus Aminicenantes bacterium]